MLTWIMVHPQMTLDHLGYIPSFLNENDPRSAREQFDANYRHGGGWTSFEGFTMLPDNSLSYQGDPPVPLLAYTRLHDKEVIRFYLHSWVAIVQPDGTYDIARLD